MLTGKYDFEGKVEHLLPVTGTNLTRRSISASIEIMKVVIKGYTLTESRIKEGSMLKTFCGGKGKVVVKAKKVKLYAVYEEQEGLRFPINGDGHCLFDSICFLYLYYARNEFVVKYDLIVKYGWLPDASNYKVNGKTKGNLMSVLSDNYIELMNQDDHEWNEDVQNYLQDWFESYKNGTNQDAPIASEDYPYTDMAYFLCSILFRDEHALCIHAYYEPDKQYCRPTVPIHNTDLTVRLPLCPSVGVGGDSECECELAHQLQEGFRLHLWLSGMHFEPVIVGLVGNKVLKEC
jgi:hypothetical protein